MVYINYISNPFNNRFMRDQVAKKLKGVKFDFYVGHSMGGIIGNYILSREDKSEKLITINSPAVDGYGYDLKNEDFFETIYDTKGDWASDDKRHTVTDKQAEEVARYIRANWNP